MKEKSNKKDSNEEFYEKLRKKLSNKRVIKQVDGLKQQIEAIMGCSVDIQFLSQDDQDEINKLNEKLKDTFEQINELGLDSSKTVKLEIPAMTVKDLKSMLVRENEHQKIFIDPVYLKSGMNPLNNAILIGMDDYVILIPKSQDNYEG